MTKRRGMGFGESNGAFETHEGDGGGGWERQGKAFWATLGSRILRRQQTGATRFCSEYLAAGRK
jgi:hypothetical protein